MLWRSPFLTGIVLGLFTKITQGASETLTTEARRRPCKESVGTGGFFNLSQHIAVLTTEQRAFP